MRANNRSTMRKGGMGDISPKASDLGEGEKGTVCHSPRAQPKKGKTNQDRKAGCRPGAAGN